MKVLNSSKPIFSISLRTESTPANYDEAGFPAHNLSEGIEFRQNPFHNYVQKLEL